MEVGLRRLRRDHRDVVGKAVFSAFAAVLDRRPALDVDAHDLPQRVDARVRSPCNGQVFVLP